MENGLQLNGLALQKIKILDVAEGKEFVSAIDSRIKQILREMQEPLNNEAWQKLNTEGYELKKARRLIQNQMTKMVARRMA